MKNILLASMEELAEQEDAEIISEISEGLSEGSPDIVQEESEEIRQEVNTELDTNDRILDTVQALESLVETVSQLPEDLSDTDQALIRNSLQMAVAGTDLPVEKFTPAIEGFTTRTVAMEGITESIKSAVASVFLSNDKILTKTEQRMAMFEVQVDRIREHLRDVTDALRESKDVGDKDVLIYLGKYCQNEKGLIKSKKEFFDAYNADCKLLGDLLNEVVKSSTVLDGMLKDTAKSFASTDKYKETLERFYTATRNDFLLKIAKSKSFKKLNSDAKTTVYATPAYLGMNRCVIVVPELATTVDAKSGEVTSAISHMNLVYSPLKTQKPSLSDQRVNFEKFTVKEVQDFVKRVESLLEVIENFTRSEARVIKNRRNLMRNVSKVISAAGVIGFGVTAVPSISGGALGTFTGGFVAGKVGLPVSNAATDIGYNVNGWILGLLSNSLRLQNKITRFYNNATNGTVEEITSHINLGYGVIERGLRTFEYK